MSQSLSRAKADMKILLLFAHLLLWVPSRLFAQSIAGTPEEFSEAGRWAAAKFEGKADSQTAARYFDVAFEVGTDWKESGQHQGIRNLCDGKPATANRGSGVSHRSVLPVRG